jgi:hypothetical protein
MARVRLEGLDQLKNPMTSSRIDPRSSGLYSFELKNIQISHNARDVFIVYKK